MEGYGNESGCCEYGLPVTELTRCLTEVTQNRLDEILDKINQKGYHFLTDEEKSFLKKASEDEGL